MRALQRSPCASAARQAAPVVPVALPAASCSGRPAVWPLQRQPRGADSSLPGPSLPGPRRARCAPLAATQTSAASVLQSVHQNGAPMRVIVAGAGIGGLVLAVALLKQGFHVQVFERDLTAIRGEGKYRGPIQASWAGAGNVRGTILSSGPRRDGAGGPINLGDVHLCLLGRWEGQRGWGAAGAESRAETSVAPFAPQVQSNALAALEAIDQEVADEVLREGCITGDRVNGLCDGLTGDWCDGCLPGRAEVTACAGLTGIAVV
jgi:hypothetical protein